MVPGGTDRDLTPTRRVIMSPSYWIDRRLEGPARVHFPVAMSHPWTRVPAPMLSMARGPSAVSTSVPTGKHPPEKVRTTGVVC